MKRALFSLIASLLAAVSIVSVAEAQDFTIPIIVDGSTYTLTVSIEDDGLSVISTSDAITVGEVTSVLTAEQIEASQDVEKLKSEAVTIEYDDLFRNNEDHVGKTVRFVGKVLEFQERTCLFCDDPGYVMRVAVTEDEYGLWDDPIWVEYNGDERFLEDDIVTVWGVVEGLETYTALLGNSVTIPKISAIDVVLGEVKNPQSAQSGVAESGNDEAAASTTDGPVTSKGANLRGGPGTNYPIVGGVTANQPLEIVARNDGASWVQLATGEWIATFLVDNLEAATDLPVAEDIPEPPAPAAEPAASSASSSASSPSTYAIGDEIQGNGWRFNVKEVHKRKAVYFYDDPHVAMGHWVVVIMDAVNAQSGTDYFANNIGPYLVDDAGNAYDLDGTASGYARWQYGGLTSIYSDVDPGELARIAIAFDIPDGVGNLRLSTDIPAWVDLGNFSEMEIEE